MACIVVHSCPEKNTKVRKSIIKKLRYFKFVSQSLKEIWSAVTLVKLLCYPPIELMKFQLVDVLFSGMSYVHFLIEFCFNFLVKTFSFQHVFVVAISDKFYK